MNNHDFKAGDLVVLSPYAGDFAKANNALYDLIAFENKLKTLAILISTNGVVVRSGVEHLIHATSDEKSVGHRIDNFEENK